jgi:hypothetical protein
MTETGVEILGERLHEEGWHPRFVTLSVTAVANA